MCQVAGGFPEAEASESGTSTLLQGSFVCDLVLIYFIKKSNFYRNKKYEEARSVMLPSQQSKGSPVEPPRSANPCLAEDLYPG